MRMCPPWILKIGFDRKDPDQITPQKLLRLGIGIYIYICPCPPYILGNARRLDTETRETRSKKKKRKKRKMWKKKWGPLAHMGPWPGPTYGWPMIWHENLIHPIPCSNQQPANTRVTIASGDQWARCMPKTVRMVMRHINYVIEN